LEDIPVGFSEFILRVVSSTDSELHTEAMQIPTEYASNSAGDLIVAAFIQVSFPDHGAKLRVVPLLIIYLHLTTLGRSLELLELPVYSALVRHGHLSSESRLLHTSKQ
jgi:hypothetical protein